MTPSAAVETRLAALATVGLLSDEVEDCGEGLALAQTSCDQFGSPTLWRTLHFEFTLEGLTELKNQLDHIDAMIIFPRMPTWSRLPALNRTGPRPVRSKDFPWGLPGLPTQANAKVDLENTLLRMTLDIARDFLTGVTAGAGRARQRRFTLLQPEDLGPLPSFLPVSLWQLPELQRLASDFNLHRQAFHQCRHQRAQHSRPTGVLTNTILPTGTAKNGWPRFERNADGLDAYVAPLTGRCGCGQRHTSMRRRHGVFRSTSRSIEAGTARLLSAAIALNEAASSAGRDGLLSVGAEENFLKAVVPDIILYQVDDDGYDTDRTVLFDPPDLFVNKTYDLINEKERIITEQEKPNTVTDQAMDRHHVRVERHHSC